MTSIQESQLVHKFGQVVGVEKARSLVLEGARANDIDVDGPYVDDECIQICMHIETEESDLVGRIANDIRVRFERKKHFESMFSVLPDPAMIVTLERGGVRIISANQSVSSTFNFDPTEREDTQLNQVLTDIYNPGFEKIVCQKLANGQQFRDEITLQRGGQPRHFVTRFSPIGATDFSIDEPVAGSSTTIPQRGILVMTEITEQKRQQQNIERLNQVSKVMNRVLRHNLRNAMTTVVGRADYLQKTLDNEEVLNSIETIQHTGTKLMEISKNARAIRDFAEEIEEDEVDLASMVRSHIESFETEYESVQIHTTIPSRAPVIAGDHLNNVIENALQNGIEHNDKATPVLEVEIMSESSSDIVILSIADNGPGIPEHELEVLNRGFETPLAHGTGLGIWLISWIVQQYDGEVSFDNRESEGTRVEIQLRKAKL